MAKEAAVSETTGFTNLSASALITTGKGKLLGIFVASASASPTLKCWDQTSAAAPILVNTFTPIAGTFYPIPGNFDNGLYVTIGGTLDCTVFWSKRD